MKNYIIKFQAYYEYGISLSFDSSTNYNGRYYDDYDYNQNDDSDFTEEKLKEFKRATYNKFFFSSILLPGNKFSDNYQNGTRYKHVNRFIYSFSLIFNS